MPTPFKTFLKASKNTQLHLHIFQGISVTNQYDLR
jgi:hypothetical protein